jgi:hypothetical protein
LIFLCLFSTGTLRNLQNSIVNLHLIQKQWSIFWESLLVCNSPTKGLRTRTTSNSATTSPNNTLSPMVLRISNPSIISMMLGNCLNRSLTSKKFVKSTLYQRISQTSTRKGSKSTSRRKPKNKIYHCHCQRCVLRNCFKLFKKKRISKTGNLINQLKSTLKLFRIKTRR